nr:ribonuclease H-like domain-containing protein [Tanacetum cinerariifolium]
MLPKITRSGQLGNTRSVCKEILDRHFARECKSHRNQESRPRNQDKSRKTVNVEDTSSKALVAIDEAGFDWSYMADDEVPTNMALMAFSDSEAYLHLQLLICPTLILRSSNTLNLKDMDLREIKWQVLLGNNGLLMLSPQHAGFGDLKLKYKILSPKTVDQTFGAPQDALKDQGYFDSGCFRLMIGNISHLTNFKEHDGGYVSFGGGAKGGKITGKGTIRTEKCIKREYSVARTPPQNRVAERRNRTLIEAAKTMLADSKLPTTFWAEAVNTAYYVQNMVLVVKHHFKTPYELFKGRSPALSFMRPFGCHVTIVNTLDQLVKFNGKLDEGIFVGYSTISKAFRVYNIRTRKVEENLHITFLENKPMIADGGPEWLFDIDALSKSMNYAPVSVGTTSNDFLGKGASFDAGQSSMETGPSQDDILMPLWKDKSLFDSSSQASDGHNKDKHGLYQASKSDNEERPNAKSDTKLVNTVGPVNTATPTYADYPNDPLMPNLEDAGIFNDAYDDRDDDAEAEYNNLETIILVSPIPSNRIHKNHPKQIIREMEPKKVTGEKKQEKDKIRTKSDKNGKRGKTRLCRRPIIVEKEEKEKKYKFKGQNMQIQEVYLIQVKRQGLNVPFAQSNITRVKAAKENAINSVQSFLRKFNRYSFFETPKVLLLAWDRVFEIKDAFGNKQYKSKDLQELFRKLFNEVQNIHEELAEYINTPGWNRPAFCDDDDDDDVDYTIAITPVLSIEEPDNSLSMGDKHLDTIPETKSDEVIKSSFEDLVPIPSEFKGIPDTMCDVHLVNNPTPLEAKDHFESVINSNDDYSSSNDDSLYNENIEYVEALPHDSEVVSLEVAQIVIPKDEEIEDDNLHEKLLNVHLLIANIEALKDSPTPSSEFLTKSSSISPKSFLEETNTFENSLPEFENFYFNLEEISSGSTITHSDISLPDYEAFYFNNDYIEEISSVSTTTHSDISLSEYDSFIFDLSNDQFPPTDRSDFTHEEFADELAHIISPPEYYCFYFRNLPDPGELISILNSGIGENLFSTTSVYLPVEDDYSPLLAYVVWIFLACLTYHVIPPYLHSFENEDTIFDPGWSISITFWFSVGFQTPDDLSGSRLGFIEKIGVHG